MSIVHYFETPVSKVFFSKENLANVDEQIRVHIYYQTGDYYGPQDPHTLMKAMRDNFNLYGYILFEDPEKNQELLDWLNTKTINDLVHSAVIAFRANKRLQRRRLFGKLGIEVISRPN